VPDQEPDRATVAEAVRKAFPYHHERILREMRWDGLMGCWMVEYCGMYVGIETDGYVHS
jgi:hypothetical protein